METREAGEISQPGPSSRCQVGLQSEDVISLEPNKRFEMMWKSYKSKQKNTANLSDDEKGKYTTMENNAKEVIQELGEQRFPTDSRWCARIFDPISCDYKEYSASRYQGKIRSEIFDLWKEFSKLDYAVDGLGICSFKQSIEEICKIIRKFSTFRRSKDSGYYFICSKHPIGIPVVSPEVPGGGVIQAIPRKRSNTAEWKHVQACLGWIYGQLTKERAYLIGIESLSDSSEKEWIDLLALVRNTRSLLRKRGVTRQSQPEAPQLKKANQYLLRKKLEISSVLEVLDSILHRRYFKCRVVQGRLHDYGEFIAWAPHLFQWYLARQVQEMLGDGYEVEREPKITLHSNTDYHVQPDIVIKQGAFYRGIIDAKLEENGNPKRFQWNKEMTVYMHCCEATNANIEENVGRKVRGVTINAQWGDEEFKDEAVGRQDIISLGVNIHNRCSSCVISGIFEKIKVSLEFMGLEYREKNGF